MTLVELAAQRLNFAARKVGDELVIVPTKNSVADMDEMFTLNEVGAFIWNNCDQHDSIDLMINAITTEFEVDAETAASDLDAFLGKMNELING